MTFLDTNILLRYLVRDDIPKANACLALLQRVRAGQEQVVTCEAILTEIVYVLSSRNVYGLDRQDIRERLTPIHKLRGLKLQHKRTYLRALDLYVIHPRLDFADAVAIAHMERLGITTLLSYDRDFDRVPGITRQEP